jgi:hypothetical protein
VDRSAFLALNLLVDKTFPAFGPIPGLLLPPSLNNGLPAEDLGPVRRRVG